MKKIALIMMAAVACHAANRILEKAEAIVNDINNRICEDRYYNRAVMCHIQNGVYMSYGGIDYVIDVRATQCFYGTKRDEFLDGGLIRCLEVEKVNRSKRLCECSAKGELTL